MDIQKITNHRGIGLGNKPGGSQKEPGHDVSKQFWQNLEFGSTTSTK